MWVPFCKEHVNFKGHRHVKIATKLGELDDENMNSLSSLEQAPLLTAHLPNINMPPFKDKDFCFI